MGMRIPPSGMSQASGAARWQQQRQSFQDLASALKSGNMDSAKQAYSALTANMAQAPDPNSPLGKLGQAIASGDATGAQQDFAALRQGGGHHHHHGGSVSGAMPSLATSGSVGTQVNTTA